MATSVSGRNPLLLIILSTGLLILSACTQSFYTSSSIRGVVYDNETKKPVEGAILVAYWEIIDTDIMGHGPHTRGYLEIDEAITDGNGEYFFPGWPPKFISTPLIDTDFLYDRMMSYKSPLIFVYKPGYIHKTVSQTSVRGPYKSLGQSHFLGSDRTKKKIFLERGEIDDRRVLKYMFDQINDRVHRPSDPSYIDCPFKKLPLFHAIAIKYDEANLDKEYSQSVGAYGKKNCGSFRGYAESQNPKLVYYGLEENYLQVGLNQLDARKLNSIISDYIENNFEDIESAPIKRNSMNYLPKDLKEEIVKIVDIGN